jgi:hypothetical protein
MNHSPGKTSHFTPDFDIQPDFFKIMPKRRTMIPFQMKKAGQLTGFFHLLMGAT